jgi:hypothetical protein
MRDRVTRPTLFGINTINQPDGMPADVTELIWAL